MQRALLRRHREAVEIRRGLMMRMYSPEELDVMAEAYIRALEQVPRELSSIEITQRLVREIGNAIADGVRDEDELANVALQRAHIGASKPRRALAANRVPADLDKKPNRAMSGWINASA
jgi:hypothetical protein